MKKKKKQTTDIRFGPFGGHDLGPRSVYLVQRHDVWRYILYYIYIIIVYAFERMCIYGFIFSIFISNAVVPYLFRTLW